MFAKVMLGSFCFVLVGCAGPARTNESGPGVTFPTSLGEGEGEGESDAGSPPRPRSSGHSEGPPASETGSMDREAMEQRKKYGSLPDPAPLSSKQQWELTLAYERGAVSLSAAQLRHFDAPVLTARRMGRFAVELWIGRELIDRVRFNFPLVAAAPDEAGGQRPLSAPPRLDREATSTQTLLIPDSPRAARLLLVDRATGLEVELPWPPRPDGPAASATNPSQEAL